MVACFGRAVLKNNMALVDTGEELLQAWVGGVSANPHQIGGVDNKASDQTAKNAAEGSTFAAAVLPLVHACDGAAATTVSNHMKFGAAVSIQVLIRTSDRVVFVISEQTSSRNPYNRQNCTL